jgi:phosphoglycolate phosphatase
MTSFEKTKAVIFDFDGTLAVLNIDFSTMREGVLALAERFGVEEGAVREKYLLEIIDEVFLVLSRQDGAEAEGFYRQAHLILHRVEIEAAGRGRLIPGTKKALKTLRQRRVKVGIITRNCEEAVKKVFPDIESHCDVFISRDAVKRVKPHPEHLRAVMEALGVSGEDAVMVGDHTLDIQAGKRVGMTTAGVLTGRIRREEFEEAGADWVLGKASEICILLEGQRE